MRDSGTIFRVRSSLVTASGFHPDDGVSITPGRSSFNGKRPNRYWCRPVKADAVGSSPTFPASMRRSFNGRTAVSKTANPGSIPGRRASLIRVVASETLGLQSRCCPARYRGGSPKDGSTGAPWRRRCERHTPPAKVYVAEANVVRRRFVVPSLFGASPNRHPIFSPAPVPSRDCPTCAQAAPVGWRVSLRRLSTMVVHSPCKGEVARSNRSRRHQFPRMTYRCGLDKRIEEVRRGESLPVGLSKIHGQHQRIPPAGARRSERRRTGGGTLVRFHDNGRRPRWVAWSLKPRGADRPRGWLPSNRPCGLQVRSPPSQGGEPGSIPGRGTTLRRVAAQWRATGLENRASRKG